MGPASKERYIEVLKAEVWSMTNGSHSFLRHIIGCIAYEAAPSFNLRSVSSAHVAGIVLTLQVTRDG